MSAQYRGELNLLLSDIPWLAKRLYGKGSNCIWEASRNMFDILMSSWVHMCELCIPHIISTNDIHRNS